MTAFDTNILIYSCDHADARRRQRAFEVLATAPDGVLLWQVAVEFVAASRKLASQGFTPSHAWARLREFMDVLPLIVPSPRVFDHAQALHVDQGISFWDAMIIGACVDCGVRTLYSEDLPGRTVGTKLQIEPIPTRMTNLAICNSIPEPLRADPGWANYSEMDSCAWPSSPAKMKQEDQDK